MRKNSPGKVNSKMHQNKIKEFKIKISSKGKVKANLISLEQNSTNEDRAEASMILKGTTVDQRLYNQTIFPK